jgi:hypothetical protein
MPEPTKPHDPLQPPPPGIPAVERPLNLPIEDDDEPDEYTDEDVKNYQKRHGI